MTRIAVVGGGIAGLAAARRLEFRVPDAEIVLLEASERVGGKLLTERVDGFLIEGAADSFLSRKERGIGLCEELGLAGRLVGRRPENARSFVRRGDELYPLPEGLTGLIPADLDALADSPLLSDEGRARLAAEPDIPPAGPDVDETVASFVTRRLGHEAYEALVEPLLTGIFGGDGDQLSLQATFPNLRALELEHGSLLCGLAARPSAPGAYPVFVSLPGGMDELVTALVGALERTRIATGVRVARVTVGDDGYAVELAHGEKAVADGVVLAVPAFVTAELLADLDPAVARLHREIPYASSAIVTLAFPDDEIPRSLAGYGYVVPRIEGSEALACTWSSSKWEGRAPAGQALVRVYLGRFGGRDVSSLPEDVLVELARDEIRILGIRVPPSLARVHRWPRGMPQYVLGHQERLERIDAALERHPGLALAGAAYRGVGIPDCIHSGEDAAGVVAEALAPAPA